MGKSKFEPGKFLGLMLIAYVTGRVVTGIMSNKTVVVATKSKQRYFKEINSESEFNKLFDGTYDNAKMPAMFVFYPGNVDLSGIKEDLRNRSESIFFINVEDLKKWKNEPDLKEHVQVWSDLKGKSTSTISWEDFVK